MLQPLQRRLLLAENELSGHSIDVKTARRLLQVDGDDGTDIAELNNTFIRRALRRLVVYQVFDVLSWIMNPSSMNTVPLPSKSSGTRPSLETLVCIYFYMSSEALKFMCIRDVYSSNTGLVSLIKQSTLWRH